MPNDHDMTYRSTVPTIIQEDQERCEFEKEGDGLIEWTDVRNMRLWVESENIELSEDKINNFNFTFYNFI